MVNLRRESSIEELVDFLKEKRNQGQKVVLYLGQKTGLCYTTLPTALAEVAQSVASLTPLLKPKYQATNYSPNILQRIQSLSNTPNIRQIRESHRVLARYFNGPGIHRVLHKALVGQRCREEDEMMAEMIKAGFFGSILITHIDDLLDRALSKVGIEPFSDYQICFCEVDNSIGTKHKGKICGPIVKIFGDFPSSSYLWGKTAFDPVADAQIKQFLLAESAKDIIILGFDPYMDQALELEKTGGTVWYVNEEEPEPSSNIARALDQRNSKYLINPQWSYRRFLGSLQPLMGETVQHAPRIHLAQAEEQIIRKKVFISYCRADHTYLERLRVHLDGHFYNEEDADAFQKEVLDIRNEVWDDTKILSGAEWEKEINDALKRAKVAVLLISADFLASDFIRKHELPVLISAINTHDVKPLMVVVAPCAFHTTPLKQFQAIHPVNKPLMSLPYYEQERIWLKLANEIMGVLKA